MSIPRLLHRSVNHELNNEGCRCGICQKVNLNENNEILVERYKDKCSQEYNHHVHKENYLILIDDLIEWEKYQRKLRFSLPEICVFEGGNPVYWVTKNKDYAQIKLIKNKTKMNMFQIQHFFLQGYLHHHPEVVNKKKEQNTFKEKAKRECIVSAKYHKNTTQLLTLDQIQSMFKSKFKYMRDGLMYLQTLVGAHLSQQSLVKLDLDELVAEHKDMYERAQKEAKIIVGETKITDNEFYHEKDEIQYERHLKKIDIKLYLIYVSLKIVFISSKLKPKIMKRAVFKWTHFKGAQFLWDIRVHEFDNSSAYWQNSVSHALEVKLKKTMSMMELQPDTNIDPTMLSHKARQMSSWLERNTVDEWNEMKIIRSRLEKLQTQKKSLLQSQKEGLQRPFAQSFRMRNLRRRQSMNQSFNPQG